ncbi:uncharacterized protein N7479_010555 [Penicillium vulpinum]|uniref:uncharacterized protein n=1 Tax=Penicillium vulpinum TaxID=29845 RepID=UPI002548F142|nr:uncharacterized protein N7479_010555 [Penicillium vulpinum]KAJ5952142.1 hypothetical protein N7479_010555 [Penicillium vulpinum]
MTLARMLLAPEVLLTEVDVIHPGAALQYRQERLSWLEPDSKTENMIPSLGDTTLLIDLVDDGG